MLDSSIRDQAYQFFQQEAVELLQVIEDGLLTLREDHSVPKVHTLMRAAHSIKGGSASVNLEGIKTIAHKLEDVFRALYSQEVTIDEDIEEILLRAYDCLKHPLTQQINTGSYDEQEALDTAEPIFSLLDQLFGDSLHANIELPTSAELGVDVVKEVFTGDVTQGIERLERVLSHPETEQVHGEIRAQSEVFMGIGELLSLPGFSEIASMVIKALDQSPELVLDIGRIAVANFKSAQQVVLNGDRSKGGTVSDQLLNLVNQLTYDNFNLEPSAFDLHDVDEIFADTNDLWEDVEISTMPLTMNNNITIVEDPPNLELELNELEEIDNIFLPEPESIVPDIEPVPTPPPPQPTKIPTPAKTVVAETNATLTESVRVDLTRLERLNNLVGELVTQENGAKLQSQHMQKALTTLQKRFIEFEKLTKNLQNWIDQSHKATSRLDQSKDTALSEENAPELDFDPLLMDTYSNLHSQFQEAIEEIAQMGEIMRDMTLIAQQSQQTQRKKQQTLKQVRNDLLWARMMPIGDVLRRFTRMVRDMATQYGKSVTCNLIGTNTLVDKAILEKLYDPLVHLIRNAFDHGIENPDERIKQGKPPEATIEIQAYHRGNQTFIEVIDDGRGINPDKIKQKAIKLGLLPTDQADNLTKEQIYEFLFSPSFSTSDSVNDLSGRGMGMTAVQEQVKQLKGKLTINSEVGIGTTFTIRLPLTLTIAKLLIFSIDNSYMAIPVDSLLAIVTAENKEIQTISGQQFYNYEQQLIPLYPCSAFSNHYPLIRTNSSKEPPMSLPKDGKIPLMLIADGADMVALEINTILYEQELVIKPFNKTVKAPSYLYGCTILGDGTLVPVIDGPALITKWLKPDQELGLVIDDSSSNSIKPQPLNLEIPKILVIDDSLTARQTLSLTLSKSGYQVVQAIDGRDALEKLKLESDIQAVFSDVEMPNMNGFEFLTACRKQYNNITLPVIMLTSRSSDKHKGIAKLLGANSYITKPYLEQDLIKTLQTCLVK